MVQRSGEMKRREKLVEFTRYTYVPLDLHHSSLASVHTSKVCAYRKSEAKV